MRTRSFAHLGNREVVQTLITRSAAECGATADVIALIGEFDARQLHREEGYPSVFEFCVRVLHLSDDAAYKRIRVARLSREFPEILEMIADGRLHMTAVLMISPHLTPTTAGELLRAVVHKTKADIELLIAERFPQSESMSMVMAIPSTPPPKCSRDSNVQSQSCQLAPERVQPVSKVAPIAPERFLFQATIGRVLRDKLEYARELGSHQVALGDYEKLLEAMADVYIAHLEKRRFAATNRARTPRKTSGSRTVPAHVRRAVWERDGGRCTYCNERGERCPARKHIEFDHVVPVARGGEACVDNIRLRCRAHNQLAAEQVFGAGFMERKREQARQAAEVRGGAANNAASADDRDIVPWLQALGIKAERARQLAAACDDMRDASLEERMRRALSRHGAGLAYRGEMAAARGA